MRRAGMQMNNVTYVGLGIIIALALSAVVVVALVLAAGVPVWAGLGLLAVMDLAIIGWGYRAVVRSVDRDG